MHRTTTRSLATAVGCLAAILLGSCGGGGGGGGGETVRFLTADPRGMTAGGGAAASAGAASPTAAPSTEAKDAATGLAREIEEADLYRVSGDTLYLLNAYRGLAIVDLAAMRVVGRLAMSGVPQEMYLHAGRAQVLLSGYDGEGTLVDVSLADPASPAEAGRFPLGGAYRASRRVGDVLYVATDTSVRSFSVSGAAAPVATAPLPLGAAFVHASDALLAVASPGDDGLTTTVTLVDISDPGGAVVVRGSVVLQGWMSDEQKLDLQGTVLRAVTHDWANTGLSRLFTVDVSSPAAPAVLATLDLARGEQLFATRFTPDAAYIVTFFQVDPLWVIDLRDPRAPRVAGTLVTPGWSEDLVATGDGRLVALGVDPSDGWKATASLYDVSDPAHLSLLGRVEFGWGWSAAFSDVRALGVFPAEGLVLVPFSGETDRLAVLDLSASALSLRGSLDMEGGVLRGFPHPRGIVGLSSEEVVVADPATLAVRGRVTVAEEVVDACRLPDGTLETLVSKSRSGRLGDVALPLVPERLFPHGTSVAVTGWDDVGRAAYVVEFSGPAPVLSARFDLGGAWFALGAPAWGAPVGIGGGGGWWGGGSGSGDSLLTDDGHLVVHGLPGVSWGLGGGIGKAGGVATGAPALRPSIDTAPDGFVVIDLPASHLDAPIEVTGYVTGFAADGGDLVYTVGGGADADPAGRPRMRHDLVRVTLSTRATAAPANVPGYVVAARGGLVFTVEESWGDGWSWDSAVVSNAVDLSTGTAEVRDRLPLPSGAYDFRAAGSALYFTTTTGSPEPLPVVLASGGASSGGGSAAAPWADPGVLGLPTTTISAVALGSTLSFGPEVSDTGHFLTLLLPEDGSALVVRDGTSVERWDLGGAAATLLWSRDAGSYPIAARPDVAGSYLVALGYMGWQELP